MGVIITTEQQRLTNNRAGRCSTLRQIGRARTLNYPETMRRLRLVDETHLLRGTKGSPKRRFVLCQRMWVMNGSTQVQYNKNKRVTFWRTRRKVDEEKVLNGERYTQSYIVAYAQGCLKMVSH